MSAPYIIILALLFFGFLFYKGVYKKKVENIVYQINEIISPSPVELQMLRHINKERLKLNIHPLKLDVKTNVLAKRRAQELIDLGVVHDHITDERKELVLLGADYVYENIAYGYTNVESTHKAFLKSEAHYKNIIQPFFDWCGFAVIDQHYCVLFGGDKAIN